MKRNCRVLIIIIVSCVLLLQVSCQDQVSTTLKSETVTKSPQQETDSAETEAALPPDESSPEIIFEKLFHNFGDVGAETTHLCNFEFANAGKGVLRIREIRSTCDCVVPELDKREYARWEAGSMKVEYHSGRRPGPVTRVVYVLSNDKSKPKVKLAIVANIKAAIDYEPKILKLSLKDENASCPQIRVHSCDNRLFAISGFESTADCISVDYDRSVEKREFVLEPKVNLARLQSNLKGHITISLTHPAYETIDIPFNALPRFRFSPPAIVVFGAKPQKQIVKEVWLINNYDENFEVESVSPGKDMIKVLSQRKIDDRYRLELEIKSPTIEGEQKEFKEVLFISIKDGPKLEFPCTWHFTGK